MARQCAPVIPRLNREHQFEQSTAGAGFGWKALGCFAKLNVPYTLPTALKTLLVTDFF